MRGKGLAVLVKGLLPRITPAYAGKRIKSMNRNSEQQDHPRVCGEKRTKQPTSWQTMGSPPRMRGKEEFACHDLSPVGITPAYAGKSFDFLLNVDGFRDHPRVCGEKV